MFAEPPSAEDVVVVAGLAQKIGQEALNLYSKRLEEGREAGKGEFPSLGRRTFEPRSLKQGEIVREAKPEVVKTEMARDLARADGQQEGPRAATGCDSGLVVVDGEAVLACHECGLPLGDFAYARDGSGAWSEDQMMHGECKAQCYVRMLRAEEQERKQKEHEIKKARREEFDIGWSPAAIPDNATSAGRLGCKAAPQGMSCLVTEKDGTLRITPTFEPAAALNLEYLSLALKVRRSEGREPLFSLDPPKNGKMEKEAPEASMQLKRFEPEWLAGTSVGEVMFQADYHLKELSFGEYEQPVVGMKSCAEYSQENADFSEWAAREWFVVRKAEIHVSDDQVLVPYLKMGVEAREQIMGNSGLEDATITRPDHPLVKYAEFFTHHFDLIAERKSVVSQLREVAKASIMAKYLLESGTALADSWFGLGEEVRPVCCLEVPQLWNDRYSNRIAVKDGTIQTGKGPKVSGLYGGVDFGIDRFRLSAPSRVATSVVAGRAVLGRPASTLMTTSRAGLGIAPARQFARLSTPLSAQMSMAASKVGLGVPRVAAGLSMGVPQGVDLNLDRFNLSTPAEASGKWGGSVRAENGELVIGSDFWSSLGEGASTFSAEDTELLREVFNPCLSDRREEGDRFAPPPTSATYLQKLRQLVKGEQTVRRQRRELFCSSGFKVDEAGPSFPASWTAAVELEKGEAKASLHARPDYVAESGLLLEALQAAAPVFDRRTEDGMRFRIYRLGSLEVRTTQEHDGQEVIGMVFSSQAPAEGEASGSESRKAIEASRQIVKVSEYVERGGESGGAGCKSYVVLETEDGAKIVMEKPSAAGAPSWSENPADLEDRNSLAKVIRVRDCRAACLTVLAMKVFHEQERLNDDLSSTRYAQAAFCRAVSEVYDPRLSLQPSGFRRPQQQQRPQQQLPRPRTYVPVYRGARNQPAMV